MGEGLKGLTVVSFESRLSKTLSDLIRLQGGEPVSAPSLKEVPLEENRPALEFGERLFRGEVDVLIYLTGVGARALTAILETAHDREKILVALRNTAIVPRGPKSLRYMNEAGLVPAFTVPEPNTWKEILAAFDARRERFPLSGRRVAVQEYGVANEEFFAGLKDRGAQIFRVPVYRWTLPDDTKPLEDAIRRIVEDRADAVVFTTSVQADHLLRVAKAAGLEAPLKEAFKKITVASVGPDCSETLRSLGLTPDLEPESPKMGPLISLLAEKGRAVRDRKRAGR